MTDQTRDLHDNAPDTERRHEILRELRKRKLIGIPAADRLLLAAQAHGDLHLDGPAAGEDVPLEENAAEILRLNDAHPDPEETPEEWQERRPWFELMLRTTNRESYETRPDDGTTSGDCDDSTQARPVLYLTNVASLLSEGFRGEGPVFNIQARPPHWGAGQGRVDVLAPLGDLELLMDAARKELRNLAGDEAFTRYRAAYEAHLAAQDLRPGHLEASTRFNVNVKVSDGQTLTCTCARDKPCHRRWAARFLVAAGWRVVLDGEELR
jgi:hypothetical protein